MEQVKQDIHDIREMLNKIDVALIGDKERGLVGMVDRLEALNNEFTSHTKGDKQAFEEVNKSILKVQAEISGIKWFASGVSAAVSAIFAVIVSFFKTS